MESYNMWSFMTGLFDNLVFSRFIYVVTCISTLAVHYMAIPCFIYP